MQKSISIFAMTIFLILGFSTTSKAIDTSTAPVEIFNRNSVTRSDYQILIPNPVDEPRINGAKIFGVRPGNPFLFTIPATGKRPMKFSAKGLPQGLKLDEEKGRINGTVGTPGTYQVILQAANSLGSHQRKFRIVVGDKICLTPPMGWNSWYCWDKTVTDEVVRAAAKAMVTSGLINHGYTYVNIDVGWPGQRGGKHNALQGNEKFPDMKGLCDYVHDLGLKIGLYSTPWISTYSNFCGGSSDNPDGSWTRTKDQRSERRIGKYTFETNDVTQWAEWGFDFLKYDWNPIDVPSTERMANTLRKCGRDVVYSLSNSASFEHAADWARLAHLWRNTRDISTSHRGENWRWVYRNGWATQNKWKPFAGPGHWNDPDMLMVGQLGYGEHLHHPSKLTADEQYAHVSLWCLLSAPLLIGGDVTKLDEFTLNLLTNDEVLQVNQDPLGEQAAQIFKKAHQEVWAKNMEDGSKAVGLFNMAQEYDQITVNWSQLVIQGKQSVRDLWRQKNIGVFEDEFVAKVPSHGVVLVRIIPITR
ncbi:MAG: putative Ig domain-containing protein [Planctomycetota bacterium]|nr:MAG: putative Ig domain-containing protein [Planctomycetota bacterium]